MSTKTERLDLRLTADQKSAIERAAQIEGTTVAGFTVAAIMEHASDAIYRAQTITLPGPAWDEFVQILDSRPPIPPTIAALLSTPSVLEQ